MRKKLIIGGIIVIILAILIFLFLDFTPTKRGTIGVFCSDEFREAHSQLNTSICESVTSDLDNPYYDNGCREWCIQEVAYTARDPQLCELINNFKNIPHVEGYDDPRETGSFKDHCYRHLATVLKDNSLCEKVETDWAKAHCGASLPTK